MQTTSTFSSTHLSLHQNIPTPPSLCRDVECVHFQNSMFFSFLLSNLPQEGNPSMSNQPACRDVECVHFVDPTNPSIYQQSYHQKVYLIRGITSRPSSINVDTQCRLQPRPQAAHVECLQILLATPKRNLTQLTTMVELVGTPCSASGIVSPSPSGHLALLHDLERKGSQAGISQIKFM